MRISLTGNDLGRVRLAGAPALMCETVLSLRWLRRDTAGRAGADWRAAVAGRLSPGMRLLHDLVPPRGYIPEFLTPYGSSADPAEAVDQVLRTPVTRLRHDVTRLATHRAVTPWMRELAEGRAPALRRLGGALLNYHRTAVAPFWRTVRDEVARERARAATLLANGGTEALLTGLSPLLRWHDPILEAAPVGEALHPNGRGLLLAPSYFCQDAPITLVRQETMPVLVFPVAHTLALVRDEVLPDLLGRSRATLLEVAADGGSTSELARRAGVLVSSASQHLTVLRRAGLVMSRREANAVIHQVTPLGVSLLRGDQSPQQV